MSSLLWAHSFPSVDLVRASAGMLTPLRAWDGSEGARARITIGPGVVSVTRRDPAKHERTAERVQHTARISADLGASDLLLEDRLLDADQAVQAVGELAAAGLAGWGDVESAGAWADHLAGRIVARDREDSPGPVTITSWSRKSRANMVRTLAGLDYGPLFAQDGPPAMLTLTYPGDWLPVAPDAATCKRHMDTFKRRFLRHFGRPLIGTWKREFQRRGAPHYHVLMVPPAPVNGEHFGSWVARVWSEIVAHPDLLERARHRAVTARPETVSFSEGMRARDPKRLAVYFSKHGAYSAKDYQNDAPAEWLAAGGSVGRFWGVWGLEKGTAVVEVTPVEALAAARTMRRWQRANGYRVQRDVFRTDTRTGLIRKRKSGVWSGSRMRGSAGFVVVNDGAAFGATLARYLDQVRESAQRDELVALGFEPWFCD